MRLFSSIKSNRIVFYRDFTADGGGTVYELDLKAVMPEFNPERRPLAGSTIEPCYPVEHFCITFHNVKP